MIDISELQQVNGAAVYAPDGDRIGSAGEVYLDNRTGEAEWVRVRTGTSGSAEALVPLDNAVLAGDGLRVAVNKNQVTGAPRIDAGSELNAAAEVQLYTYYGLDPAGCPETGAADNAMIRTERSGPVRLRKYLVTEQSAAAGEVAQLP